ncbi:hypothetical protein KIW84_041921 [Lathyrus oleraceus]|uniref:DUF7745 domain-containing protein n=1 Tax=Pisum sativum TaxID=3888 RepID=A0A9D5ASP9_PEA|nr:hypothetical protein KIW84_041921 [Pisum sativum]
MGMGKKVKPKEMTVTLGIPIEDLLSHYKEDRDIQGLKRSYLEGVSRRMVGAERWRSYVDVLALIIETSHEELFRKVTRAWEKVHVKENKLKRKDTSSEESCTPWVKERIRLIKLPFMVDPTNVPEIPDLIPVSIGEVDRLRATIVGL